MNTSKFLRLEAAAIRRNVKAMEQIKVKLQWLQNDDNCSSAASLTDAMLVLIDEAIRLHRAEIPKKLQRKSEVTA
jgi:hypothetical protein